VGGRSGIIYCFSFLRGYFVTMVSYYLLTYLRGSEGGEGVYRPDRDFYSWRS
jgi:hypothetical protein